MKNTHAIGLTVAAVAITVAIEESRISNLRAGAAESGAPLTAASAATGSPGVTAISGESPSTKVAARAVPDSTETESDGDPLGKTVRKMWDNPAGKAMMNQGVKIAVAMMYEDFIEGLDLTKEEADYFKNLLGKGLADQQEIGMKLISATPEERTALVAELEARKKENEEAIKAFLNNDEDHQRYLDYQNRLPERYQLDGIRAAFATKEAPLDSETEGRLVEAMFRARTTSNAPDFLGPDAFTKMAGEDFAANFEKTWELQEQALMKEAAEILDEPQMAAFREYREQMKEMQLMGIEMAEKMMSGDTEDGE